MIITLSMLNLLHTLNSDTDAPSLHAKCDNPSVSDFNFTGKEIWENIPFTDGYYQVSNHGNICTWHKPKSVTGERSNDMALMKCSLNHGYKSISIIQVGVLPKNKTHRVHRLVATMFIPNPNNYPIIMYIDDIKTNCHYTNLKWGTSLDNNRDAFKKGLIIPAKGEARKKSNLTNKDVVKIFKSKKTCRELAKLYKVNHTCIVDICSGRSWNHITGLPCTRKIKPKFSKDIKFKDK